jgi:tetratricopeptide (TPR) repeat protein
LLVVAAALLAYHNSFTGPFIFDDVRSIRHNPTIRHLWPIWQTLRPLHQGGLTVEGRPLINLSLAINYALGGLDVRGYHALNLTVHILAGLTLLGVVRRTLLQPRLRGRFGEAALPLALATAILWTVHPLQTEAVTYVIQRAESIMGLFYLLTLYCFIRGVGSATPRRWYGLCVAACGLGMASKEVMVSAPVLVLLYDRAFLAGSFRESWRRRWPLYLGLAATWVLLGLVLVSAGNFATAFSKARGVGHTWWQYSLNEPGVLLYYLRLSVWPYPLCLDYVWPFARTWTSILPPAVAIGVLLGASVWAWKRNSVWGFAGAWFFLTLAPSSSFIPLDSPIYEHRMYLASAAVVSIIVLGLYSLAGRHSLAVFALLAIGLGFLTWRRNQDYRSDLVLWADVVAKRPGSVRGHTNLGLALLDGGKAAESIPHFMDALRLDPNQPIVHCDLGSAFVASGAIEKGIAQYEEALRLDPNFAPARAALGDVLANQSDVRAALEQYQAALALNPNDAATHFNLAQLLARMGRREEAITQYTEALRLDPADAMAHYNLANLLAELGRETEAVSHYSAAARLAPGDARSRINLGNLFLKQAHWDDAIAAYAEALRIDPNAFEAHNNMAIALANRGDLVHAVEQFREAVRLNPTPPEVHSALADVLERLGRHQEAQQELAEARRLTESAGPH